MQVRPLSSSALVGIDIGTSSAKGSLRSGVRKVLAGAESSYL